MKGILNYNHLKMDLNKLCSTLKKVCMLFLIPYPSFQVPESIFSPNDSRKLNALKA